MWIIFISLDLLGDLPNHISSLSVSFSLFLWNFFPSFFFPLWYVCPLYETRQEKWSFYTRSVCLPSPLYYIFFDKSALKRFFINICRLEYEERPFMVTGVSESSLESRQMPCNSGSQPFCAHAPTNIKVQSVPRI